tara:strand:- start:308 stop:592 length:285 start_codon:yes stop_codon:yes gene_type:complete
VVVQHQVQVVVFQYQVILVVLVVEELKLVVQAQVVQQEETLEDLLPNLVNQVYQVVLGMEVLVELDGHTTGQAVVAEELVVQDKKLKVVFQINA